MPEVLLVAHNYPPHIGGLERVVQKQAESQADDGYQVVVLTSRFGHVLDADRGGAGVKVIGIQCSHILERLLNIPFPLFSPALVWQAWRLVRRAQVVHLHDVFYLSSWLAGTWAIILRKPLLITQHVALVDHSSYLVILVQRLVYATIGQWLFSSARKVVVYNENIRSFLRARGVPQERILLLSNGIDTTAFRPAAPEERAVIRQRFGLPEGRVLVLFVGRLVEKKGFKILLGAQDPAYDLVFAGPGPIPKEGRVKGVHWMGAMEQEQTAELFRACDLFAFPATGEIFTLVMQEAMASGLPVVTTDDPAYRHSVVSRCVTFCPRDRDSFREALLAALRDPAQLRRLSGESREVAVRSFDWRKNFRSLQATYSQILADHSLAR